jgi:hypothetical protein
MRNFCGAPDLPFFETVAWYFKQFAAGVIVVTVLFGFIALGWLALNWKGKR